MIDTLVELKKKLLDKHKRTSNSTQPGEEYEQGFLAGLESVLLEVDRMMEGESEKQAQYYKED